MRNARLFTKLVIAALIAALVVARGLSFFKRHYPRASDAGAARHFSLGYIPGAQDFVLFVMESRGLLRQYRLEPEKIRFLNPPNLHLMIAERRVDIGFGGFTTMATARAEGKDVIVIHGVFSPVNVVFVRKNSPIHSLNDLKGKKLGDFGGPGSTTLAFLAVIASKLYGLDITRDVQSVTAPGPALSNLLDKGEIDAALMGTTESIKFAAEGKYRVLIDLSEEYKKWQGLAPAHVTVATSEQFASQHAELLKDFLRACHDAVQYSKNNPEIWVRYGKTIGMNSEAETTLLREKMIPNLVDRWDSEQIEIQRQYLTLVQSVLGKRYLGVIPENLIRNDFNP